MAVCYRIFPCVLKSISICRFASVSVRLTIEPVNVSIHCYMLFFVIIRQYVTIWYSLCQFAPETSSYVCIICYYELQNMP